MNHKEQSFQSELFGPTVFRNVEFGMARAVVGVEEQRVLIDGRFSINKVKSAKFGEELHLQVFAGAYRVEKRNKSVYSRSEIYIPLRDVDSLIAALQKAKEEDVHDSDSGREECAGVRPGGE